MTRIIDWYFQLLKFAVVLCLASMVVLVFSNVVLRYAFNSGITVSEELARWLFVWLIYFGAIIGMREHTHLGMDSVVSRLPVWGKKGCYVLSHFLMLGCSFLFLIGSWNQTIINIEVKAPATGISSGYFYGIGLLFSASAILIILYDLYQMLGGKLQEVDLIQVKESEDVLEIKQLNEEMQRETAKLSSSAKT